MYEKTTDMTGSAKTVREQNPEGDNEGGRKVNETPTQHAGDNGNTHRHGH